MKKVILSLFVTGLCLIMLSSLSSCAKKGCTNPKSDNYNEKAKKDDGTCVPWRDKFIAIYSTTDNCNPGITYNLTLTASSVDEDKVIITDANISFDGEVTSQDVVTIPEQTGNSNGIPYTINGSGTLNGSTFSMNYTFSAGGQAVSCAATGIKQ